MLEYSGRTNDLFAAFRGAKAVSTDAVTDGALRPPGAPGIGIEPEPDITERYPYREPPPITSRPSLYQGSV
jgi:L-alanine-DL-glutamate epimerase-like enolase superfamily enzyme